MISIHGHEFGVNLGDPEALAATGRGHKRRQPLAHLQRNVLGKAFQRYLLNKLGLHGPICLVGLERELLPISRGHTHDS